MSSGTDWDEHYYSPLSITTRAYFDDNLREVILGLKVVEPPVQKFKYASGDTQLLGIVIEKPRVRPLQRTSAHIFGNHLAPSILPTGNSTLKILAWKRPIVDLRRTH